MGGETAGDSLHGGLFHGLGDGGIGVEHIRPGHHIAAGLLENAGALAHIGLADIQEQAALQVAEFMVHLGFDIHCYAS